MTVEGEHYSWCPAEQNAAKPRSQQLIGPMCTCEKTRRERQEFIDRLEAGEFDSEIDAMVKENTDLDHPE